VEACLEGAQRPVRSFFPVADLAEFQDALRDARLT
jgi:hypothetical protein